MVLGRHHIPEYAHRCQICAYLPIGVSCDLPFRPFSKDIRKALVQRSRLAIIDQAGSLIDYCMGHFMANHV